MRKILLYCISAIILWAFLYTFSMEFLSDMSSNFWQLLMFIFAVLLAFATYMHFRSENMEKEEAKKRAAREGVVKSNSKNINELVTFHVGNSQARVLLSDLKNGYEFKPLKTLIAAEYPIFVITYKDGRILISAKFKSINGEIIAEISNNEWQINPNNYFKRNFDKNALEVIDKEGITKVQIDFTDMYNIRISGVYYDGNGLLWSVNPNGSMTFNSISVGKSILTKQSEAVPNLFKYPEDKYFGIRNSK